MAWTYANWNDPSATDAVRLANLRRFRGEIQAAIVGANVNGADMAIDYGELRQLSQDLAAEEDRLQARVDGAGGNRRSLIRYRK